uniref:JmjC domain-containing protein n=1 Tax=Alexandrium catenella TaxID=2925 RepID=A0A7S1RNS0_ALECA
MRLGWRRGKKLESDEEREGMRRALAESRPREKFPLGADVENLTQQVLAHSGGMEVDWLRKHKSFEALGRPAQEPIVDASEVGRALKEGRLVRFDATQILPQKTFNVTLERLSQLHGAEGDGISILAYMHESKRCRETAWYFRRNNPVGALLCPRSPTLGEARRHVRARFPNPSHMPMSSRIALRRLPNYINEDALVKDLGLEGVERPEGQIILGHAWGDTHWDEQDNVFIQASGIAVVLGVPPEYSDAVMGTEGHSAKSSGMDWDKWLEHDEVRKTSIPWYYMVLKPGDGIAIPSRAFHAVYGSHNRASLQTFLEPQYLGMRWDTNKHSYWHKETETRQALRNIFFKTTGRLWDTRRVGMIQQGGCIEYL